MNATITTEYWSEEAKKDKLYYAIRANDSAEIERLKAAGVTLSEFVKEMLRSGGGSVDSTDIYGMDWYDFKCGLDNYTSEEFISMIRNLYEALGEPICFMDSVGREIRGFYRPDVFGCVLDCFNNKKMRKKWMLREIVDSENPGLLEICAEHGWLTRAKQRGELIEYARENNRVECTAWLMDYMNRMVDLKAEREKSDKRQAALLNASPDSVAALRQLWRYKKYDGGGLIVTSYKGGCSEIAVPERIGRELVTAVGVALLSWGEPYTDFAESGIKKITLPRTVKVIGECTFYDLGELEEINIPDGVTEIGNKAFYCCKNLKRLSLPDSVEKIGFCTFLGCGELLEINIPNGITELPGSVFLKCEKLKSVEIPETVRTIGEYAFNGCKSITAVTIPRGVPKIEDHTFAGCERLKSVILPDTVVKIGKNAFSDCAALNEIEIPEGVREIDETAFAACAALEKIVLPASLEKAKNLTQKGMATKTIFDNSPDVMAVVTPKSYAEKYCKRNGIPFVYKENQFGKD